MRGQSKSEILLDNERRACIEHLSFFRKKICKYLDFQQFHQKLDYVLTSQSKYKRIIIPRNHLKSSAVMSWILWCLLKNPNLSILYESSIYDQALKYLGEMKKHIESPEWRIYFGDWMGKPWADNKIMINKRTHIQPAPTISASGVDKAQTGQHYDVIVLDDLVNENNSRAADQREKVIGRYQQALSLLRPNGVLVVVGTPWDRDDLYGWMDKRPEVMSLFEHVKFDVYDENGKILFHQKFCETIEEEKRNPGKRSLESLRAQYSPYQFSCQYRCNAEAEEYAEFKRSWLKWDDKQTIGNRLKNIRGKIGIFCDPAMGKEHTIRPCDTAIIHAHFMPNNKIDILWEDVMTCTPGDTIEKLHGYAMSYMLKGMDVEVFIEDVGFQGFLISLLEEKRNKGMYYLISPVRPHGDKDRRIRGLFPYYQAGQITHSEVIKGKILEDQLIRFPKGEKKDAVDSLSQFINRINFPVVYQEKIGNNVSYDLPIANQYSKRAPMQNRSKGQINEKSYLSDTLGSIYKIGV